MDQPSAEPRTISVDLGQRSYDIHIGDDLLPGIGPRVKQLRPPSQHVAE